MRRLDCPAIDLNAETGAIWDSDLAAPDLQRFFGKRLAVLPDPVRIDRRDLARRGGADMGEHGKRDIKMIVGMRAPGQPIVAAGLRHAYRALHGPEMRIGEWDVDRSEPQRMAELAPVGRDHVGRGR